MKIKDKIKDKLKDKKIDKKLLANIIITILITLAIILISAFCFGDSYVRLIETLKDLFVSIKFYFCKLFNISIEVPVTVEEYSEVYELPSNAPESSEEFENGFVQFFGLFFSRDNLVNWLRTFLPSLIVLARISALLIPLLVILILVLKKLYLMPNTNHDKDTVPLRIFKKISNRIYHPAKFFIRDYLCFLSTVPFVKMLWLLMFLFSLNFASIIIGFLAYYFYFAMSYDFSTMYIQFVKLFVDLKVFFASPFVLLLIPICIHVFVLFRNDRALAKLTHMERQNRGFINDLPIVSMTCGSMGKKKTTIITDMALSQEVMFRDKAFEKLKECDMRFPHFPWILFELDIKKKMEERIIYNLATCRMFVDDLRIAFEQEHKVYNYDYVKYGYTFDDCLKVSGLFDVLSIYAQLYFVYIMESSLIVANYSIRTDNEIDDLGNFPLWHSNFFPIHHTQNNKHAHILDYDTLRLGKKLIESNPNIGSFEFGVVVMSEVGKERGNNLELKDVKKGTDETNQKNDLFNSWLKMCRHSATIDNFPFIKVFTDEQRPESWGADARDLCDIVNIISTGEQKLALPFYNLEERICVGCYEKFINFYYKVRHFRGDNTLLIHLLKMVTACLYKHNIRIYNQYGYSAVNVEKERGTLDGKTEKKKYYIMNRKIYSHRFSTDCFSDYFNDLAKKTKVGLNDYLEYETERATIEELRLQNSYFINALYKDTDSSPDD